MPARIEYLRPEGCKLWTPQPHYLFKEDPCANRSGRWLFPLEDVVSGENRLIVLKVDPADRVSFLFKSEPVNKFPHFSQLGEMATRICEREYLVNAVMPGHPILDGEYVDKAHGPLSFVFTHEDMPALTKRSNEHIWTVTQLGQGTSQETLWAA